jgi:menaquinone-dependent protoporphyrinogen IX oxidase
LPLSPLPVIEMSILVAYVSKHGATGEIAERIVQGLRAAGQHAGARPVQEAGDLGDDEGLVIGSAAYGAAWAEHPGTSRQPRCHRNRGVAHVAF